MSLLLLQPGGQVHTQQGRTGREAEGTQEGLPPQRGQRPRSTRELRWGEKRQRGVVSARSRRALQADPHCSPLALQAKVGPWGRGSCTEAAGTTLPWGISTFTVAVTPPPSPPLPTALGPGLKISPAGWSLDFNRGGCGCVGTRGICPGLVSREGRHLLGCRHRGGSRGASLGLKGGRGVG